MSSSEQYTILFAPGKIFFTAIDESIFVFHASNDPNDTIEPAAMRIAIGSVGLRGWTPPGTKGTCVIFQKNPHLYIYFLTTSLPVATKMILSNPFRLWDPPSCVEYR